MDLVGLCSPGLPVLPAAFEGNSLAWLSKRKTPLGFHHPEAHRGRSGAAAGERFASGDTSLSAAKLIFDREADRVSERSQEECFVPSRHLRLSPTLDAPAAHSGASGAGIQASSDDVEERFPVSVRYTNQKDGCPGG